MPNARPHCPDSAHSEIVADDRLWRLHTTIVGADAEFAVADCIRCGKRLSRPVATVVGGCTEDDHAALKLDRARVAAETMHAGWQDDGGGGRLELRWCSACASTLAIAEVDRG